MSVFGHQATLSAFERPYCYSAIREAALTGNANINANDVGVISVGRQTVGQSVNVDSKLESHSALFIGLG